MILGMDTAQAADIQKTLGKNLKALRNAMGLSQQELAERCGLSPNYLGSVEIGQKYPSAKTLNILSLVLRVPPYRFFLPLNQGDSLPLRLTDTWVSQLQHRINDLLLESVASLEELLAADAQVAEDPRTSNPGTPRKGKLT